MFNWSLVAKSAYDVGGKSMNNKELIWHHHGERNLNINLLID